jgi:hypothetical protein
LSKNTDITVLVEEIKKVNNKIKRTKHITVILGLGLFVSMAFIVVYGIAWVFFGGYHWSGAVIIFINILVINAFLVPLVMFGKRNTKLMEQEYELNKKLQALNYPMQHCSRCGKALSESEESCLYCGNRRTAR